MAVSAAHCEVLAKVGAVSDGMWAELGREIAGERAYESVHYQAAQWAHPSFPVFLTGLGMMPALSNGARVNLWGSPDPLAVVVLNVNHSQTRKSRLGALAEAAASHVDSYVARRLLEFFEAKKEAHAAVCAAKRRGGGGGAGDEVPVAAEEDKLAFPGTLSVAFMGGTIEKAKEKVSGDFCTVRQNKAVQKLPMLQSRVIDEKFQFADDAERAMLASSGMQGRIWFGQPLIYDEIYQLLQDLSLLDKPGDKKAAETSTAGQTPLAGWFNRLLQSGKSDHTKSNGGHGGLGCPSVSTSIVGNFHPTPAIEMLRGERGDHGCQAKARLLVCTGLPVQPHAAFTKPDGTPMEVEWHPIPRAIWEGVGFEHGQLESVHAFTRHYAPLGYAGDDCDMEEDAGGAPPPAFVPNEVGFNQTLRDGVVVGVRMALVGERYEPQWSLANRRFAIDEGSRMGDRFGVLVAHTKTQAHRVLEMDPGAVGEFTGICVLYNINVKVSRDACLADDGAEWGTSPWKLGMLAACLVLWDIMWGSGVPSWVVTRGHVQRAFKLMRILDATRQAFRGTSEVGVEPSQAAIEDWKGQERVAEDRNLPGLVPILGTTHTMIGRRMLAKASKADEPDEFEFKVLHAYRLFTPKEKKDLGLGNVSVHLIRDLAKSASFHLGTFDPVKDAFVFRMPHPVAATDLQKEALLNFANTAVDYVRACLKKRAQCG